MLIIGYHEPLKPIGPLISLTLIPLKVKSVQLSRALCPFCSLAVLYLVLKVGILQDLEI